VDARFWRCAALAAVVLALAGCGSAGGRAASSVRVVAAENFWGSIAEQLAGSKLPVTSIVVNPSTDPHDYQPTAGDARTMAVARLAIVNGLGYDTWASKLLDASPLSGRTVVDVGDLLGLQQGDNPHQWYDPASVTKVVDAISAAYAKLDAADASYFAARKQHFLSASLKTYDSLRAQIRTRFAGVPVGYSESIFEPLGRDLHLRLATPYGFAKAVSEGSEIGAGDKQTVEAQARSGAIKVWITNSQNDTPDIQRITAICKEQHIPVVTVTETLSPATASFEQWQAAQLRRLIVALHEATGR
jgi:zinc/manganese transport system substrate-binding protein